MGRPARRKKVYRKRWYYVRSGEAKSGRRRVRGRRVYCSDVFFCFLWRGRKFSGSWYVSEMRTGLTVAREESAERAQEVARQVLDSPGLSPLRDRIQRSDVIIKPKTPGRRVLYTQPDVEKELELV